MQTVLLGEEEPPVSSALSSAETRLSSIALAHLPEGRPESSIRNLENCVQHDGAREDAWLSEAHRDRSVALVRPPSIDASNGMSSATAERSSLRKPCADG